MKLLGAQGQGAVSTVKPLNSNSLYVTEGFFFLKYCINNIICPSTDEWIKKMWHIYTMEYYSAIKRNETELFVVRWMDLEIVIQSEVSQQEKNKYRMLTHIYGI